MSFAVNNSRNMWAMRIIFCSKSSKFNAESKNAIKIQENVFSFEYNCFLTGSDKLSAIVGEY